jgi:hypothetical protein
MGNGVNYATTGHTSCVLQRRFPWLDAIRLCNNTLLIQEGVERKAIGWKQGSVRDASRICFDPAGSKQIKHRMSTMVFTNKFGRLPEKPLNYGKQQIVQVPAGQLNCWALFKDCVGVSCMYKLFKLGVLFPCKHSLQIWSIGWEVFGETPSWWTPTCTTTNWPLIILGLPHPFF